MFAIRPIFGTDSDSYKNFLLRIRILTKIRLKMKELIRGFRILIFFTNSGFWTADSDAKIVQKLDGFRIANPNAITFEYYSTKQHLTRPRVWVKMCAHFSPLKILRIQYRLPPIKP